MNNKNFDFNDQSELQTSFWQSAPKQSQHLTEFTASAIERDLIRLNFRSIGQEAFSGLVRNVSVFAQNLLVISDLGGSK
jgi:hypothetical protein